MKKILVLFTFLSTTLMFSQTYVNGYIRSDGTYVKPHYRSDKDYSFDNNWSTRGNQNPYTYKWGTLRRRGY